MTISNHLIVDEGDTRRWSVTFLNASLAPVNPTTVTFVRRLPTESTASLTVTTGWTNPATGVFYRDVFFNAAGLWEMEARGTGAGGDQTERLTVDVRPTRVS